MCPRDVFPSETQLPPYLMCFEGAQILRQKFALIRFRYLKDATYQ